MAKRKAGGDSRTLLTPDAGGRLVALSNDTSGRRVWRKRILPEGEINYKGRRIRFDRPYLTSLAQAFDAKALDQTPLQFAGADNAHTNDVERTRGEVLRMSLAGPDDTDGPGLYADFVMHSKRGEKVIKQNPRLGVSCSIEEGRKRVDGAGFPRVVRHVLATLDPRVVKLGDWRPVTLANESGGRVINLTGARFKEIPVAKSGGKRKQAVADDLELSEGDAEAAVAAALAEADAEPDNDDTGGKAVAKSKSKAKGGKAKGGGKGKAAKLSNAKGGRRLSLAARVDDLSLAHEQTQIDLAESRWETLRSQLAGDVPKVILDLAARVMSSVDASVELSNSGGTETVDLAAVVGEILAEVAAMDGTIDLSDPDGLGDDPADGRQSKVQGYLDDWAARSGS